MNHFYDLGKYNLAYAGMDDPTRNISFQYHYSIK